MGTGKEGTPMKLHSVSAKVLKRKQITDSVVYVQDGLVEQARAYIASKHPGLSVSRERAETVLTAAMLDTWKSGKHNRAGEMIFRSGGINLFATATKAGTGFDFRIYSR